MKLFPVSGTASTSQKTNTLAAASGVVTATLSDGDLNTHWTH